MKEFNLELAKAGHSVQTRDGRKARIICWDVNNDKFPIIALIETPNDQREVALYFTINGHFVNDECRVDGDLVMASEKHEGWINLYECGNDRTADLVYNTEEKAKSDGKKSADYITTIKIEWED